jgi:hypothetical protein
VSLRIFLSVQIFVQKLLQLVLGEDLGRLLVGNRPLDLIHMLILVSRTVFIAVCTPPVAILFSASAQLVSSDLLFGHGGRGAEEVAQEGGRVQIDRTRQANRRSG